jgi:error-prone DNA polymerase
MLNLARRSGLGREDLKTLAAADALASLSGQRRQQVWDAAAWLGHQADLLGQDEADDMLRDEAEEQVQLQAAPEAEDILYDYASTGLSLRRHPVALLRERLAAQQLQSAAQLNNSRHSQLVKACGIVTMRQQPQTAKGTVFVSLEDETGTVNVIVWKRLRERQREVLLHARLMAVYGQWQFDQDTGGRVKHLIAHHLVDMTALLGKLTTESRDFR